MGSVAENDLPQGDRLAQAQQLDQLWQRLQAGAPRSGAIRDEDREDKILSRLVRLCTPEIVQVVLENPAGRILSALRVTPLENHLRVDDKHGVIWATVRLALETKGTNEPIHVRIKVCMSEALRNAVDTFDQWFYKADAAQLLPLLLSLPRPAVMRIGGYLNRQQRSGLRRLLYQELGNKPMLLHLDREPEEQHKWLYWYLWRWEVTQPGVKRALGGTPQYLFVGDGDALPINKQTGEPLDPLGPIHAKVWPRLGRELNKRGHPIKDPESKSRTARSLGVDRSTLERYLKADIGREPKLDGKGDVNYQFTDADVIRSIEAVVRKRGPRPSDQ